MLVIVCLTLQIVQAQKTVDYPQLKKFSPLGITFHGISYNGFHSFDGEFGSTNVFDLESNRNFNYSIGLNYTFYKANKLSFITNVAIDIVPWLKKNNGYTMSSNKITLEDWNHSTAFSLSVLLQYRQRIKNDLYINGKIGPKLLGYNNEGFSVNTVISDNLNNNYQLNASVRSSSSWSSSILLGLGISYDVNIALIDFNLLGNFNLGSLYRGYYTTTSSDNTTLSYGFEQSGTYYGIGITIYPKMFWKK